MELNKKTILMIGFLVVLFIVLGIVINLTRDESNNNSISNNKISVVKNYNDFYTVNSCVYRYLTYLKDKDTNSLMKLLDEEFVTSNNINSNNLYNFLTVYDGNVSFNSRKMFEEKINNNIIKYYVYGYVEKDIIDSAPEQIDAYFMVKLDKKNHLFSISPYSGELFR